MPTNDTRPARHATPPCRTAIVTAATSTLPITSCVFADGRPAFVLHLSGGLCAFVQSAADPSGRLFVILDGADARALYNSIPSDAELDADRKREQRSIDAGEAAENERLGSRI